MARNGNYSVGSGDDFADMVQENYQEVKIVFEQVEPDKGEMPFIESRTPEGDICKFAVSKNGFLLLTEDIIQINSETPVGQYVMTNWPNIKPGDIITPNGSTVIKVGTLTLPPDFTPYKKF